MGCKTQWRTSFGGLVGLDYPAVAQVAEWLGLDLRIPRLRAGIMTIERLMLEQQAEKAKDKADT